MQPSLSTPSSLKSWFPTLPWLFAIGFVFWFGSLAMFGINMDQGYAMFREDQRIWLSQGRWTIFLLAQYIHPQPVLAYFPHLVYVLCAVCAYPLLLDALQVSTRSKKAALLAFPLFMAHPIWYFILEFTANTVPTGLGLLSTAMAVWLFAVLIQQRSPLHPLLNGLLQIVLLCLALGLYQSLLFMAATFYLALLIKYYVQRPLCLKPLLLSAFILGVGLATNSLLLELLYKLYETQDDYVSNNLHLNKIIENTSHALNFTLSNLREVYLGETRVYSTSFITSGLIFILTAGYFLLVQAKNTYLQISQNNQERRGLSALILLVLSVFVLLVLFVPLIPQLLTGGVYRMPYRTLIAVSTPLWLATIYLLTQAQNKSWRYVVLAVVVCSQIQILHIHARFNSSTALLKNYDRTLATAIYNRATEFIPHFSLQTPTSFDISGGINYTPIYGDPPSSLMTDSFFGQKYDVQMRVGNFMRSQGLTGLVPVNMNYHLALKPYYADMPSWPADGSMRMHDGILLIKLSD